jgi:squalene-hopene/tetraprenyl-beta-curcumene cyclase
MLFLVPTPRRCSATRILRFGHSEFGAWLVALVAVHGMIESGRADEPAAWTKSAAGRYLDERIETWLNFASANRGEADTRSSCISCHTVAPYMIARPALRKLSGAAEPTEFEERFLAQTKMRVEHWQELDSPRYRLLYDSDERKKKESWGTEAVLNAVILAFDDFDQQRPASHLTRVALANLWQAQLDEGDDRGSWDWLDFGLGPWEGHEGRYFGAALAAIANGTAPGYYTPGADADVDANVALLCTYLRDHRLQQNLFNRVWLLWAANGIDGLLTPQERKSLVEELYREQQADGGWALVSLTQDAGNDGTPHDTASDGYATGLVLHVLQTVGESKTIPEISRGLEWLHANQSPSGQWAASSINKKRDPTTHAGHFMSDAATAYAILALSH